MQRPEKLDPMVSNPQKKAPVPINITSATKECRSDCDAW